jgi:hypothetical protein
MAANSNTNPFAEAALARARSEASQEIVIHMPDTSKPFTREERQGLANYRARELAVAINAHIEANTRRAIEAVEIAGETTYMNALQKLAILRSMPGLDPDLQQFADAYTNETAKSLGANLRAVSDYTVQHLVALSQERIDVEPRRERIKFSEWFLQDE